MAHRDLSLGGGVTKNPASVTALRGSDRHEGRFTAMNAAKHDVSSEATDQENGADVRRIVHVNGWELAAFASMTSGR